MPDDSYLDPYRESTIRHGTSFAVTLWASTHSQERRFDAFTEMCYLHGKRLLDAGCSRGDMANYLFEKQVEFASYVGIDGMANVIDFANSRRIPHCQFQQGDFVTEPGLLGQGNPQVILISGTLNTMTDTQAMVVLEAAWSHASEILLFNFLSDRCSSQAPPQDDFSRRLNTLEMIRWATSKTPDVIYRQDYLAHGHDGTIMMKKEEKRA